MSGSVSSIPAGATLLLLNRQFSAAASWFTNYDVSQIGVWSVLTGLAAVRYVNRDPSWKEIQSIIRRGSGRSCSTVSHKLNSFICLVSSSSYTKSKTDPSHHSGFHTEFYKENTYFKPGILQQSKHAFYGTSALQDGFNVLFMCFPMLYISETVCEPDNAGIGK